MALLATLLTKIKKLFFVLFSVLKKPFCCRKRNRRNSGHLLPVTVERSNKNLESFSGYPSNSSSVVNQTNWVQNDVSTQYTTNSMNSNVISHKNNFQSNLSPNSHSNENRANAQTNEGDTDFFSDMVPRFKKPKKIILASNQSNDSQMSNRFGVDSKATIFQSKELGVIDHFEDGNSSWEDSAANEEMWDTDQTLRKMRQQEREKRIAEHQRIKIEKEFKRSKQPKGNLLATKIS